MESIYLKVTRDYTPTDREARFGGKDEAITVEKGDIIFDVRKEDDGWLCGKNLNSGKTGRFPSDCVANLSDDKSNSSAKNTDKKDSSTTTPSLARDTKTVDSKRTTEPSSLRRPANPRPFGLSSRFPRSYEREKKESSGDSGVGVEDGEDYYLNDDLPDKKKPLSSLDSRKPSTESETKKPSIYESRFGNRTYSPTYSSRPSVSRLKSAFLENDQKSKTSTDMKAKDKPKESIEMTKKPAVGSESKEKDKKTGKPALAAEEDDDDGMYASAEVDGKPTADVNKNKKPDTGNKLLKDKKVNIKDNPLSKEKPPPYHSYQVPLGPDKPPRSGNGGCADCDEPHIYADPASAGIQPPTDHYMEPEASSPKYDFDPTENPQQKLLEKTNDDGKSEANRRLYNRMASYESISNVGPDKTTSKARSSESIKDTMKAVKKTKQKLAAPEKYARIRIIVGSTLGVFFGIFVFLLFFLVIPLHVISAIVAGIIIGLVFAMIFGFLDRKRLLCITLLIFPSIFATRGKIALWLLILYFLIAGPLCNFISNSNIIGLHRGECFVLFAGAAESNNSTQNGTDIVHPSYERNVDPLFQHYVDVVNQLDNTINKSSTPWHNNSTLAKLCSDYSTTLRNNCQILANNSYYSCMADSKSPCVLKRCQTLVPRNVCSSWYDFEKECINNADRSIVMLIREVIQQSPGHAALAAYKYNKQPMLVTPAKRTCKDVVSVLTMLLPLLILLVLYEAYSYHKLYLARNDFDNQYLTNHFKTIEDTRKASGSSDGLLPLKKCEHERFIQPTSPQFTIAERNNMLMYLLVYVIFLLFALLLILGDYYLYFIVSKDHHASTEDSTVQTRSSNSTNTTSVPNNTTSKAAGVLTCAPLVIPLEKYYVVVISMLLGLLLLMIIFQPYVLRLRHFIASHLYRRRERKRVAFIYYKLLEERKAFYKTVIDNIHMESEENYAMDQLDAVRMLAWNFQPMEKLFSVLGVSLRKCMVCGRGLSRQYVYCETEGCESIYCRTCFWDLGNKCLGCMRDSKPVTRSSSFIQGSSRKRKCDVTPTQGV